MGTLAPMPLDAVCPVQCPWLWSLHCPHARWVSSPRLPMCWSGGIRAGGTELGNFLESPFFPRTQIHLQRGRLHWDCLPPHGQNWDINVFYRWSSTHKRADSGGRLVSEWAESANLWTGRLAAICSALEHWQLLLLLSRFYSRRGLHNLPYRHPCTYNILVFCSPFLRVSFKHVWKVQLHGQNASFQVNTQIGAITKDIVSAYCTASALQDQGLFLPWLNVTAVI